MENLYIDLGTTEHGEVTDAERATGGQLIGRFGLKNVPAWFHLLSLSEYDQRYVSEVALKPGERILRYVTHHTAISRLYPLIKINPDRHLIYFLTQAAFDEGYTEFLSRGEKAAWLHLNSTQIA